MFIYHDFNYSLQRPQADKKRVYRVLQCREQELTQVNTSIQYKFIY